MGGEDVILSPEARKHIPYSIECKNVEKLNVWAAIDQCKTNCGERVPIVVMKKNRRNPYAIINLDSFIDLIKEQMAYLTETEISKEEHLKMLIKEIRIISKRMQDLEEQTEHILRKKLY